MSEIAAIRRRKAGGETGPVLAREYGISRSTLYAIINSQTWRK